MIKISDADVEVAHAAFFEAEGHAHKAIRAALERVVSLHPEWTISKPIHVTEIEIDNCTREWKKVYTSGSTSKGAVEFCLSWYAEYLNKKKSVDPRIQIVHKWAEVELELNVSEESIKRVLTQMDEMKSTTTGAP